MSGTLLRASVAHRLFDRRGMPIGLLVFLLAANSVPADGQSATGIEAFASSAQTFTRDRNSLKPDGRIEGHVRSWDSAARPLEMVQVRLSGPNGNRVTLTDRFGAFKFEALQGGRYSITAAKAGFATASLGQRAIGGLGTPLFLSDHATITDADITLATGGVIAGTVRDENGDPIVEAQVRALQVRFVRGERTLMQVGSSALSNDLGEFRVFGLLPGRYYVSVRVPNRASDPAFEGVPAGYAITYYPASTNPNEAQPVQLGVAESVGGVDITVAPARLATVQGVVLGEDGTIMKSGRVSAMPRGVALSGVVMGAASISPSGAFMIQGLPPGEFTLRATSPPSRPGVPSSSALGIVDVGLQDVTNVTLHPVTFRKVHGRLVLDSIPTMSLQPTRIHVVAQFVKADSSIAQPPPAQLRNDLSFDFMLPSSEVVLRPTGLPPEWMLAKVLEGGRDVTDGGLDAGGDVSEIEIHVGTRHQVVSGLVNATDGNVCAGATIILFPQDPSKRVPPTRFIALSIAGSDCQFSVGSLPPERYFAVAVDFVEPDRMGDPELLRDLEPLATRFALEEGVAAKVDLRLLSVP